MFCHIGRAYRSTWCKGYPGCAPAVSLRYEDFAPGLCFVHQPSWARSFRFLFLHFCFQENGFLILAAQSFLILGRILFHRRFLFIYDSPPINLGCDLLDLWIDQKGLLMFRYGHWFFVQGLLFVNYICFTFSFCFLADRGQESPFSCKAIAACFDLGSLAAHLLLLTWVSRPRSQDLFLRSMGSHST